MVGSLTLAIAFNDLGVVVEIVGATGSILISYILPGALYLSIYKGGDLEIIAKIQLILGIFIIPISLFSIFSS